MVSPKSGHSGEDEARRYCEGIFPLAGGIQQCLDHIWYNELSQELSEPASGHSDTEREINDQLDGKDENKLDDEDGLDAEGSVESGSGQDEGGDLATRINTLLDRK